MEYKISPLYSKKPIHIYLPFDKNKEDNLKIDWKSESIHKSYKNRINNTNCEQYNQKVLSELENSLYFKLHKISFIENLNNSLTKWNLQHNSIKKAREIFSTKHNNFNSNLPFTIKYNLEFCKSKMNGRNCSKELSLPIKSNIISNIDSTSILSNVSSLHNHKFFHFQKCSYLHKIRYSNNLRIKFKNNKSYSHSLNLLNVAKKKCIAKHLGRINHSRNSNGITYQNKSLNLSYVSDLILPLKNPIIKNQFRLHHKFVSLSNKKKAKFILPQTHIENYKDFCSIANIN